MSQMVGTQATMNVLTGQRYKVVSNEVKSYLLGSYGQSPVPIQESLRRSIIGDQEVISDRPANHLPPEFETLKAELGDLARSDEDCLLTHSSLKSAKNSCSRRMDNGKNHLKS